MKKTFYKDAACVLCIACCLYSNCSISQDTSWFKKLTNRYLSNDKDTVKRNNFFPFPVGAIAPETGLEYGFTAIYSFYTDKHDQETRVSTLNFLGTYTTKNQTSLKLVSDIWTKLNRYHYYSEFRYRNYPYDFYGIGADTKAENKDPIYEKRLRLIVGVDKKIVNHYYIGVKVAYENYTYRNLNTKGIFTTGDYFGKYGGKQIYFGLQQIYDSRNNITYTTKGLYGNLSFNYTPDFFAGKNYHGIFINIDGRYFTPITKQITLGVNGVYQEISGKNVPFYLTPQLGSEDMMRGYYQGRFRDRNLLAMQTEFRYRFIPRFAVIAFGGYGTVYGQKHFSMDMLKPNYGIGFRYFFDLNKDLSLRFDYGMGEKLPGEKRISGYYFSMREAF